MYIVKFIDKLTGGWSYQHKGLYQNMGQCDLFTKDMCFNSIDEAKAHIQHTLLFPDTGRWRCDVDESYFEIVEVYELPMMKDTYTSIETLKKLA